MPSGTNTLGKDIVSAYIVTGARVSAWIIVTATVHRVAGDFAFALLALVQSTVGILEYAAIGVSPAIIRVAAEAIRKMRGSGVAPESESNPEPFKLSYESHRSEPVQSVYANGFAMAMLTAVAGGLFLLVFLFIFRSTRTNLQSGGVAFELVLLVGVSTLLRMMSDAPGAALQTCGQIFLDNLLLTACESVWGIGTVIDLFVFHLPWQRATGFALLCGAIVLLISRSVASHRYGSGLFDHWWKRIDGAMLRRLLIYGGMVVAAQAADYLYAPTDNFLIWKLIDLPTVAVYAPAVQIDGGVLLLVSAVASVLLPRTALAHATGNSQTVRRYYVRGTLSTAAVLIAAAPIAWLAAPTLFKLWLGSPMQATCAILPIMLIHTVVGGSSAVGRSILLAIGKVRAFTVSVLVAGVANVALSYSFVRFGHLGLRGIVLGTIVAVTGRCAIWLPWYVLKTLRAEEMVTEPAVTEIPPPAVVP